MYRRHAISFIFLALSIFSLGHAQTIAEKKASLGSTSSDLTPEMQTFLVHLNSEHEELEKELQQLYQQARYLHQQNASEQAYKVLLNKINADRERMAELQSQWREMAAQSQEDEYALWHQPSATLEQLVIDYGSQDYVYIIPQDIANMTVSITSNLPIPRSSWSDMLEIILSQNGVGMRQLNPYLRELYLLKNDHSALKLITNRRQDLMALPDNERIAFVITPEPSEVRRIWLFLERFVNPNSTSLQMVGRDILVVAQASEVRELLKLYDFASSNRGDKEYKVITLSRVDADEMARILGVVFGLLTDNKGPTTSPRGSSPKKPMLPPNMQPPMLPPPPSSSRGESDENGLKVIPLTQVARAIFLIGTKEEIRKAESIIREVEDQVGESQGKLIYWYTVKYSEAEELAQVLSRIYDLMVTRGIGFEDSPPPDEEIVGSKGNNINITTQAAPAPPPLPPMPPAPPLRRPYEQGFFFDEGFVVNRRLPPRPPMVNSNRDNFLVDQKTGTIVMVVEAEVMPRMKELIRKLDVPKKMVQIEVLLFEKRITRENNFGLNLLRIGNGIASNTHVTGATFNVRPTADTPEGIFQFLLSRERFCSVAPYDIAYRFLLTQDDVHINASPSVLAINQTPAVIDITEEISINTGIYAVDTVGGVTLDNAFARAEYGIKLEIIPNIHMPDVGDYFDSDTPAQVSLSTDITFQTVAPGPAAQQPNVTTRHIINDVCIPDGQTVILGGLRSRNTRDRVEKIPFLGDIPCLGKLFSLTDLQEDTTEMFIFLTPKIIVDPACDLERVKMRQLMLRPGDVPCFLCQLVAAEEYESRCLCESTMAMLFGLAPDRCVCPLGEYDGR